MKNLILSFSTFLFLTSAGCAHRHTVVKSAPDSEFPEGTAISIGSPEVAVGDSVRVYRENCKTISRGENKSTVGNCARDFVGNAKVVKVLSHKRATVQPQSDFVIEKNMIVEKE